MTRGGARPNSGPKKGTKYKPTLQKELLREVMRERIVLKVDPHLDEMVEAQAMHAKGVSYMVLRAPDGSFARATDQKQIDAACKAGATAFRIFTQAPNPQAFTALLDRTIGKPSEHVELTGAQGGPVEVTLVARLQAAKKRLSGQKAER
jgi:hypothetical protein